MSVLEFEAEDHSNPNHALKPYVIIWVESIYEDRTDVTIGYGGGLTKDGALWVLDEATNALLGEDSE